MLNSILSEHHGNRQLKKSNSFSLTLKIRGESMEGAPGGLPWPTSIFLDIIYSKNENNMKFNI